MTMFKINLRFCNALNILYKFPEYPSEIRKQIIATGCHLWWKITESREGIRMSIKAVLQTWQPGAKVGSAFS